MKKIFHYAAISILTFFLIVEVSTASTARKRFRKTYDFKPGSELILDNTNGSRRIDTWTKQEVLIEAEIKVKARSRREAENFLDRVEILIEKHRYGLEIRSHYPRRYRDSGFFSWFKKPSVSINYTITVPAKADLDIETTNGSIYARRVNGRINTRSTNGKIGLTMVKGSVKARTTNGSIEVELVDILRNEDMEFSTTNGGIRTYFPRNLRADLYASTTNGSITTDFPIEVRGRWNRKRLQGRINGGGGYIRMSTTNGSIKILERKIIKSIKK